MINTSTSGPTSNRPEPLIGSGDPRTLYWAEGYQRAAEAGICHAARPLHRERRSIKDDLRKMASSGMSTATKQT